MTSLKLGASIRKGNTHGLSFERTSLPQCSDTPSYELDHHVKQTPVEAPTAWQEPRELPSTPVADRPPKWTPY